MPLNLGRILQKSSLLGQQNVKLLFVRNFERPVKCGGTTRLECDVLY